MVTKFDEAKLKNYNARTSSHQKNYLLRKAGIECEDIAKQGGASIAIANIVEAEANNEFLPDVTLPAHCFCDKYLGNGRADLRSLRNPKYRDGVDISLLAKAGTKFKQASKPRKVKAVKPPEVRRTSPFEAPKLGEMTQVKRIWGVVKK